MKRVTKTLLSALLLAMACAINATADDYQYSNPVINADFPDPTIVRAPNGRFYAFSTNPRVKKYSSKDLVKWSDVGYAFSETGKPSFVSGAGVWAPDVSYVDGKYIMYYSMSTWGGEWTCGIGVATTNSITSNFTDHGKLFTSEEIGVQNSIDPFFFEDEDSSKYLFWGSFHGIYGIQLSDDGMSVMEGAEKFKISGSMTEGTYIYKHGDYYYLFGSAGSCCEGLSSTYNLRVARSKSIKGPYLDENGSKALDNNLTMILSKSSSVVGPGHCSEIIEDDLGQTWILYHGYRADDPDRGRCCFLSQLFWDNNGWPYFVGDKPADTWDKPVFGENPYTYSDVEYIDYQGTDENYTYLFDTGLVPSASNKIEFDCYTYPENELGETTVGDKWRAICSGRSSYSDGISVYIVPEGDKWGYYVGGYINNGLGTHEFETKYNVVARLADITINGEKTSTNRSNYTSTTKRLTFFSGLQDYPYVGRIYDFKVYKTASKLLRNYIPKMRNEDEMPVFYDTINDTYIRPYSEVGFGVGPIVDAIKNISTDNVSTDDNIYDLQGRKVENPTKKGIYIKGGKKTIL